LGKKGLLHLGGVRRHSVSGTNGRSVNVQTRKGYRKIASTREEIQVPRGGTGIGKKVYEKP